MCALMLLGPVEGSAQFLRGNRSSSVVNIDGVGYYVHTVKKGETLYSLAKLYGVSERDIIGNNPQAVEGLRTDQVLKIPTGPEKPLTEKQQARRFDTHTVQKGETAYAIARNYGISVNTLVEDNPDLDPTKLSLGLELNIRKSGQGSQSASQIKDQWDEYARNLASVTPGTEYHVVRQGETLYGLSRQYGVPQHDIVEANNIETATLKAGEMLKIPLKKEETPAAQPEVTETQPGQDESTEGDSLSPFGGLFGGGRQAAEPKRFEGGTMNVAMLLPLSGQGAAGRNFLEFYQGGLIALEDLKRQGISVQLNLYDTERSAVRTEQEVESYPFAGTNLIVGPVYEEALAPVLKFAREKRVPVVSPLAQIEQLQSPLLYQLSPDPATKYDKLRKVISADKDVILVTGTTTDAEFEREIVPLLPSGYRRYAFSRGAAASALGDMIRGGRETVFVVVIQDEYTIDDFMARLSSVRNNLTARSISTGSVTVVGSSRWQRFSIADKNLFFKLNLCFVTSYHADRSNQTVLDFNKRYIGSFNSLPSLYSYRGYDAVKLFVGTYARWSTSSLSFQSAVNLSSQELLQMSYKFDQSSRGMNHVNTEWALVCYGSDYTIEVR